MGEHRREGATPLQGIGNAFTLTNGSNRNRDHVLQLDILKHVASDLHRRQKLYAACQQRRERTSEASQSRQQHQTSKQWKLKPHSIPSQMADLRAFPSSKVPSGSSRNTKNQPPILGDHVRGKDQQLGIPGQGLTQVVEDARQLWNNRRHQEQNQTKREDTHHNRVSQRGSDLPLEACLSLHEV